MALFFSEQGSLSVRFLHYKTLKNPQIKNIIKTKWPCPSICHGVDTFLVGFHGFCKTKKQNGRTHVPVFGMGFCTFVFCFSRFLQSAGRVSKP